MNGNQRFIFFILGPQSVEPFEENEEVLFCWRRCVLLVLSFQKLTSFPALFLPHVVDQKEALSYCPITTPACCPAP